MKEHKVIENKFKWISLDKRVSRYGGNMPPRKPEIRSSVLWLARDGNEVYLVNLSNEVLDLVVADCGGFITADDDVGTITSPDNYEYKNVKPNDAVKVEEYDGYYDLDYVLMVSLEVKSKTIGSIEVFTPAKKGGVYEMVLLWDNGDAGKNVRIRKCN